MQQISDRLGNAHKVCRKRGRRVLQIFQKTNRSPRDHRASIHINIQRAKGANTHNNI